jgi:hypothetical protein
MSGGTTPRTGLLAVGAGIAGVALASLCGALLSVVVGTPSSAGGCPSSAEAGSIVLGPPGEGQIVGASEYGGPGDPRSGIVGARGDNLLEHPDSYAELGGLTWDTARAMGGLPYLAPLRITWATHSAIAYKRDFGLGGGPVAGHERVIDLWWQLAGGLGIPYEDGLWSGPVRIERPPLSGAGGVLGLVAGGPGSGSLSDSGAPPNPGTPSDPSAPAGTCAQTDPGGVPVTAGPQARLLSDGLAAAPAGAPRAVQEIIAAGNQIAAKPYVYGAAHGLPLSAVGSAYDCSSSVEHLLYGARLLPVTYGAASSSLESFGAPGAGQWVTLYANPDHVFMYVAGLRWDTWAAAGAGDGNDGIGWHPLVRSSAGFVARHPVGL